MIPQQIDELDRQVVALYQQGLYERAIPLALQVCDLTRQYAGERNSYFAQSLNTLGLLYQAMGDYANAESSLKRSSEIAREVLGEDHPNYATSLNNLAILFQKMGNYSAAVPLYRHALNIWRRAWGEDHPDYAKGLNNLAEAFREIGDYTQAELLIHQALEIKRKAPGENHPDYATSLINLAALYYSIGNYAAAAPLIQQASEIRRITLGKEHPDYAQSLNSLGAVYRELGNYNGAEACIRQALEIKSTTLGQEHPEYAQSLISLAELYYSMGNYAAAEPQFIQAIEIFRKSLGEQHPVYRDSLNNLAVLFAATNRAINALSLMEKAAVIDDRMVVQIFMIGPESQRMAYLATLQTTLYGLLSLVLEYLADSGEAVQAALDLVLRRKAIGIEVLAARRDVVLGGRYPELLPKIQILKAWRRILAQQTLAGPGPEGLQAHRQLLAKWAAQGDYLEADLVNQIPEMNLEQNLRAVNRQAIASALPAGSALVEFVRFDIFDFKAVLARGEKQWKPAHYLAFILHAGSPDTVEMIDLGKAQSIERMIARFRAGLTGGDRKLGSSERSSGRLYKRKVGICLRKAVFDPLRAALRDCQHVFLATDGDLARLPFEALPLNDNSYLIDEYHLSYLSVGRDVIRIGARANGQPANSLVIADADFDLESHSSSEKAVSALSYGRVSYSLDRGSLWFKRLPGTRIEGEFIACLLEVKPWLKRKALKGRLKAISSPRILHIATHGFFLEDQKRDPNRPGSAGGTASNLFGRLSYALESPLLRSGLALAGANTWMQGKPLPPEAEDAILNAEDVSGMDLADTELVVLSACDTGLGTIQAGEGVFGLRRSFVLAGAHTLVMSMWKVPDRQTQELMGDFYQRLKNGEPRSEALREAQLTMKKQYPEPFFWGAFILQGDPGPLLGL